ncbi:MAG TPA: hypothetical protein VKD67_07245 [Acidimicrobiales bacterium]|nr:hypothetical protein [Acidimicrobiales bacterium]
MSVVTALLYYFGWARTNAMAGFFGIDPDVLGYSTQDYMLRSVDALYRPLAVVAVVALLAVGADHLLIAGLSRYQGPRPVVRAVSAALVLAGVGMLLTGVVRLDGVAVARPYLLTPLLLVGGAVLVGYGARVLRREVGDGQKQRLGRLVTVLLGAIVVAGLFAAAFRYATEIGSQRAQEIVKGLAYRPNVIVHSAQHLDLAAAGVQEVALAQGDAAFHFRYTGLKLLSMTKDRALLLPACWQAGSPVVFVLMSRPDVRIDMENVAVLPGAPPVICAR